MIPRYKEIKAFTDIYVRSYFVIIGDVLTGFNQSF